jgi:chitin synthase
LPGAGDLVNLLRYFIISSMAFYIIPLVLYGIFFFRIKYFWEILSGTLSFLFYSPSYLNLLNIYALCRIDDISWGTKGLDASVGGKNAKLKDTWKIVKMIDVAKFFIWNVLVGVIFIIFDGYLIIKFFLSLILLMLFTFIQAIKIFIGVSYLIKYKFITAKKNQVIRDNPDAPATQDEEVVKPTT